MTMNYEPNPISWAKWSMKTAHVVPPKTLLIMPWGLGPAEPSPYNRPAKSFLYLYRTMKEG